MSTVQKICNNLEWDGSWGYIWYHDAVVNMSSGVKTRLLYHFYITVLHFSIYEIHACLNKCRLPTEMDLMTILSVLVLLQEKINHSYNLPPYNNDIHAILKMNTAIPLPCIISGTKYLTRIPVYSPQN